MPQTSQRIDGQVWAAVGPGATIRGWTYPTMHPSRQFESLDEAARQLGYGWDGLSPEEQAAWQSKAGSWWQWMLCAVKKIPPMPFYDVRDGFKLFVATNTARQIQGLGPVRSPGQVKWPPPPGRVKVIARPKSPSEPGPQVQRVAATIWGPPVPAGMRRTVGCWMSDNCAGGLSQVQESKARFVGFIDAEDGEETSLDLLLQSSMRLIEGTYVRLFVAAGVWGLAPQMVVVFGFDNNRARLIEGWGYVAWGEEPWGSLCWELYGFGQSPWGLMWWGW